VISNAYFNKFFDWRWGWHSIDGVATREGVRQPRNRGSLPVEFIIFFFGVTIPALGVHPASHLVGTRGTFQGCKSAGARNNLHLVVWLRRRRGAITRLAHIHDMHRDSFSFTLYFSAFSPYVLTHLPVLTVMWDKNCVTFAGFFIIIFFIFLYHEHFERQHFHS